MAKIIAWLRGFEHKSFEAITAAFHRAHDELLSLAAHHGGKTVEKGKIIARLETEIDKHREEAERAIGAARKIGGLIA
jgi:hypothetical protein